MSDADLPGLRLLNDHPVSDGVQDDLLDRSAEAARLADLPRDSRHSAPFTFAVYADWGMGKSSLLRLGLAPFSNPPLVRHLLSRGAQVVEADSSSGAIAAIRSQAVDAVIADPFPGWNGFSYISELRKHAELGDLLPALVLATA